MSRFDKLGDRPWILCLTILGLATFLTVGSTSAHAQCKTNADCKFDRVCHVGVCSLPTAKTPGSAKKAAASEAEAPAESRAINAEPIPPMDPGPVEAVTTLLQELFSWSIIAAVVFLGVRIRDRRRYAFADFDGRRVLHTVLITLESDKTLADISAVVGDLLTRLHGLEQLIRSDKAPPKETLPPELLALLAHGRFGEVTASTGVDTSDGEAFASLRRYFDS